MVLIGKVAHEVVAVGFFSHYLCVLNHKDFYHNHKENVLSASLNKHFLPSSLGISLSLSVLTNCIFVLHAEIVSIFVFTHSVKCLIS